MDLDISFENFSYIYSAWCAYVNCTVTHQVTLSGSVLVHSGRRPSLFWVSLIQTNSGLQPG